LKDYDELGKLGKHYSFLSFHTHQLGKFIQRDHDEYLVYLKNYQLTQSINPHYPNELFQN